MDAPFALASRGSRRTSVGCCAFRVTRRRSRSCRHHRCIRRSTCRVCGTWRGSRASPQAGGLRKLAQRDGVKALLVGKSQGAADDACQICDGETRLLHADGGAITFRNARAKRFRRERVRPRSPASEIHAASPYFIPDLFGVVVDPGVGFAPLSLFLAQRVAVGKGANRNFLRERSLAFSVECNVADLPRERRSITKRYFTSGQPPSFSGRNAWSAGTSASSL